MTEFNAFTFCMNLVDVHTMTDVQISSMDRFITKFDEYKVAILMDDALMQLYLYYITRYLGSTLECWSYLSCVTS